VDGYAGDGCEQGRNLYTDKTDVNGWTRNSIDIMKKSVRSVFISVIRVAMKGIRAFLPAQCHPPLFALVPIFYRLIAGPSAFDSQIFECYKSINKPAAFRFPGGSGFFIYHGQADQTRRPG
jgi:hypothetical protein